MKYVFGPIPSRRLGRSLGVDLVPFKTCSYDCIYCQLGRTTCKTIDRQKWVRWDPVLEELKRSLDNPPDYITLSGSGEPTLHADLGTLISRIKTITSIPVAVLTNGSLLWRSDVRQDLLQADLVIPSLDAGDADRFHYVNRPHARLSCEAMIEGLIAFREEFKGQYWLEVFLVGGHTPVVHAAEKIAECARKIGPDRIQLNTVARPPAESFAEPVPSEQLSQLAKLFEPQAEVIVDYPHSSPHGSPHSTGDDIINTLRRRPCRLEDIMAAHGLHRAEAIKCMDELLRDGLIERVVRNSDAYYKAIGHDGR